jgi:hypothetical protein
MRAVVILHERLGKWNRQLRPRLSDRPVRWFESRSAADLEAILQGLAFPVVLIDLGGQPIHGLDALDLVRIRTPGARCLVLDPEEEAGTRIMARELGATQVWSGFAPPPLVAGLIARWIAMARPALESAGWSRTTFPETVTDPWAWLADYLREPDPMNQTPRDPRRWARSNLEEARDND